MHYFLKKPHLHIVVFAYFSVFSFFSSQRWYRMLIIWFLVLCDLKQNVFVVNKLNAVWAELKMFFVLLKIPGHMFVFLHNCGNNTICGSRYLIDDLTGHGEDFLSPLPHHHKPLQPVNLNSVWSELSLPWQTGLQMQYRRGL